MAALFSEEAKVAQLALQRAAILTRRVFREKVKGTQAKADRSPVTIGDYGSQALIIAALRHNFPDDAIAGEEEASSLQDNDQLRAQVWEQVKSARLEDEAAEALLGGSIRSEESMIDNINGGNSPGGPKGRFWTLDPIDGTAGFLRGGQYALGVALIIDGDVKVGAIACPNLPNDDSQDLPADIGSNVPDDEANGVLASAVIGQGAICRPLGRGDLGPSHSIHVRAVDDLSNATFCEGVEAGHSSHGDQAAIAQKLGIERQSLRLDSQAKYVAVARGNSDIYLRLKTNKSYKECIWDHASGDLIGREAGGEVTDSLGKRLDFSKGLKLLDNEGIVFCGKSVHSKVLAAVQEVTGIKATTNL